MFRKLRQSELGRSVAVLASGNVAAQLVTLAVSPLLTRLYDPGSFGAFIVCYSIVGTLGLVASARYELAIPIAKDDSRALDALWLSTIICVLTSALWVVVFALGGSKLLAMLHISGLRSWVFLIPLWILLSGLYNAASYIALRRKKFAQMAKTSFAQTAIGAAIGVGVGATYAGPLGLLLNGMAVPGTGVFTLFPASLRDIGIPLGTSFARLKSVAHEYRQFPLFSVWASLANQCSILLPAVMLSYCYGTQVTGYFGLSNRIVALPMGLFGTAISQVFLSEGSRLAINNPPALPELFRRITGRLLKLSLFVVGMGALSPLLFGMVFGAKWSGAGWYAALLAVCGAAQLVVSPVGTITTIAKRQDLQLVMDLIRLVVVSAALYMPYRFGCTAVVSVAVYSLAMVAVYAMYYIAYCAVVRGMVVRMAANTE